MRNYRLLINDIEIDLSQDTILQLNKSTFNLGEFTSKVSYSNNIDIVLTPNNIKAFSYNNDINSINGLSKEKLKATLIINDINIFDNGVAFINSVSEKKINIMLASEAITFFQLTDKSLKLLDCNNLNVGWTAWHIANYNNINPDYSVDQIRYLLCETNTNTVYDTIGTVDNICIADLTHPSIRINEVMKRIINQAGYTEDFTDWADIVRDSFLYLSDTLQLLNAKMKASYGETPSHLYNGYNDFSYTQHNYDLKTYNIISGAQNIDYYGGGTIYYRVKYSGTYRVRVRGDVYVPQNQEQPITNINILLNINNGDTIIVNLNGQENNSFDHYIDVTLGASTYLWFMKIMVNADGKKSYTPFEAFPSEFYIKNFYCEITPITDMQILFGGTFEVNAGMPEIKQNEFFKAVCQLSFLIPEIDEQEKIIKLIPIKNIISNIANAQDLSNNYCGLKSQEYKFGKWAKNNVFQYKGDVMSEWYKGIGNVTIINELLEKEVVFFDSIFGATPEVIRTLNLESVAFCPIYEDGVFKNKLKPRIIYPKKIYNGKEYQLVNKDYTVVYGPIIDDPNFGAFIDLEWDNLLNNNIDAFSYIYNMRAVKVEVLLTDIEFHNLSLSRVIFIEQLQSYLYLQKVSGFVSGKKCTLEMIKIL